METLRFGILGPLEARGAQRAISLGGRRQRAVLAVLLTAPNRVVSVDHLIDAVWEERPPATAKATVQSYIARLRRALHTAAPTAPPVLCTEGTGYVLRVTPESIDAVVFERLASRGSAALSAGDPGEAAELFTDALALWRGPALSDFAFDAFAIGEAARLEELRLAVTEDRVEAALALGRHNALVGELDQLVATYPLRERMRGQLMLVLYRSGRQAEALRLYQAGRRLLADDLGIDPGPALKGLETAILLQDPSLDWTPPQASPTVDSGENLAAEQSARPPIGREPAHRCSVALSETVTFLMVRLELPIGLWDEQPDLAGSILARYEALVAEVCREHDGVLAADREGDHLTVVFRRAAAAATAATELQRTILRAAWPAGVHVRSAVALHTGEAVITDGRYHGQAVSRAAVLRSLAHSGQILCTQATADVIGEHLPPKASLERVATCRLSELNRPEPVWQVGHPDLPSTFPPLPLLEAPPDNLPTAATSFVGREQDVADIRKHLESTRLVTIVGPGGIGKTRLALQVAFELSSAYADGTWFIDLAPQTDPTLVVSSVAAALSVQEQPGRPLIETVTAHLRTREQLLVLDNCEHVLSGCVPFLNSVLRTAPNVRLLATSRERTRVPGELSWAAPPLTTPAPPDVRSIADLEPYEATRLFLDRAHAAQPQLDFEDADAPAIARICHHLDGLPLAIELAAARVSMLTPGEILDRLEDRFRLLTSGPLPDTARHATLRAALHWSYDLLETAEQTVLRRLAVFAGSFTLTAAEAVAAGPLLDKSEVFDVLESLVSKSLVVREPTATESRFRLLETIRCYAAERLAGSGDAGNAARNHVDFYLALAEQLESEAFGASPGPALDRLEAEHDNLRAALNRIVADPNLRRSALRLVHAMFPLWEMRGHRAEGRAAMDALLVQPGSGDPLESAVARRAGNLALTDGDEQSAERLWRHALGLARDAGDERHTGRALISVARAVRSGGDLDAARALLDEGHAIAARIGDVLFADTALIRLGWLAYDQARYPDAQRHAEACTDRNDGSWMNAARAFDILGCVARDRGDCREASRCFEEAFRISDSARDQYCRAEALDGLGSVAAAEGRWDDARVAWEEAVVLLRQGPRLVVVGPLGGLADIASRDGDHETARLLLEEELAAADRTKDPADTARTLLRLGHAAHARGDQADAVSWFTQLLELAHRIGMPWHVAGALDGVAVSIGGGEPSVTMAATADALRCTIGAVRPAPNRDQFDDWLTATRRHLGDCRFDAAWTAGQRADINAVVAAALAAAEPI